METNVYEKIVFEEKREEFEKFRSLLLEYNEKYNLTSITEEKDIYYKHFLDSVIGERFFKEGARVCEIGSGAGFPSIPLKILRPDLKLDLFESVGKSALFCRRLWITFNSKMCIFITFALKRGQRAWILEKSMITQRRARWRE